MVTDSGAQKHMCVECVNTGKERKGTDQGGEVGVEWGRGWRVRKGVEVPALCLGLVPPATSPLL